MTDDFTEDFDDDPLPEEFQDEEPVKAPPRINPSTRNRVRQPQQPQQHSQPRYPVQAPASAPVKTQEVQYVPFSLPARVGVYDNYAGKPMMEDPDKMDLILGLCTEILNRISNIERNL